MDGPAFFKGGDVYGDISASHGRLQIAPDAAIASLELRKTKDLWRRGKRLNGFFGREAGELFPRGLTFPLELMKNGICLIQAGAVEG